MKSFLSHSCPLFRQWLLAWKECFAEHWLKELQESICICTGRSDITEIMLKTALNTVQSINQLRVNPKELIKTYFNSFIYLDILVSDQSAHDGLLKVRSTLPEEM